MKTFVLGVVKSLTSLLCFNCYSSTSPTENEKNCVEKNVSTPGISIYFEAYLYGTGNYSNYSNSSWQLPASALMAPQSRPSMGDEEDEHDSPVEDQPEKVKKPKKVYCYISPKVGEERIEREGHCSRNRTCSTVGCVADLSLTGTFTFLLHSNCP